MATRTWTDGGPAPASGRLPPRWLGVLAWSLVVRTVARRDDRGDVPGWVMITVMTAGLVAILAAVAGPTLKSMLQEALSSVGG